MDTNMQAQTLIDNGYHIVPINKGQKGPFVKQWQSRDFTASDIDAGIGIKTGIGDYPLCAVDIDVLDAELAERFAAMCHYTYGMTVERVGNAPKTMLIYRAAEAGWSKATSKWFTDSDGVKQRLEILGKGQQFVGYAIHPDTNKPYEWVDFLGGLESVAASELPVLTEYDVASIIASFEDAAFDAGLNVVEGSARRAGVRFNVDPDDFTAGAKVGLYIEDAKDLLEHLDASDYDRWVQVGMALHHEFDGDADALALFDDWSATASNYSDSDDVAKRWESFGGGGITARTLIKWGNEASAKHEREVKKSVIDDYKADIAAAGDVFDLEEALQKIGNELKPSEVITCSEVKAAAKARYKELTGQTLTEAVANQLLGLHKDTSGENLERQTAYTEFGNAAKLLELHGEDVMYASDTDTWYRWTGSFWRVGTQAEIEQLAKKTVLSLFTDVAAGDRLGTDEFDFIRGSCNAKMMREMVKIIRTESEVLVRTDELDADKNIFACANGAIDLTTGEMLPPDRVHRSTIASDTAYKPKAKGPLFEQTVSDAFYGDKDMISFFQRLMGYTMLGNPREDLLVIPYGTGSNGKSTILGAIRDAMGNHAVTAGNETFLGNGGSSGAGPRDDILRLRGSRFVYVTEPDDDRELKEGLIKSMTGGENMSARSAYSKTFVTFKPTWTVIMPTNHKPIIKGSDYGIWRRIMLIPFVRNFSTDPDIVKDLDRADKLKLEQEGILAWLVRGALEYLADGLNPPAAIEKAREEYKQDMDLLAEWIEDCCTIGRNEAATNKELWESWRRFADERGELRYISNNRLLNKRLEARDHIERIKDTMGIRGRGLVGISVNDIFEEDAEKADD